jgi:uncharacterized protein YqgQ
MYDLVYDADTVQQALRQYVICMIMSMPQYVLCMIMSMPQIVYSRRFVSMYDVDNLFTVQQALRQYVCSDMCIMYNV